MQPALQLVSVFAGDSCPSFGIFELSYFLVFEIYAKSIRSHTPIPYLLLPPLLGEEGEQRDGAVEQEDERVVGGGGRRR